MTAAIDLFAGLGGFTTGATMAGVKVVWAANHWPDAVKWHSANHPNTDHACQDLQQADWSQVPRHDILMASPSCQGFSRARGKDTPQHDTSRSTAWAVVSCAEYHRPPVVLVENVQEFLGWILFPAWELAMQRLGYSITPYVVDAADHGVPQNRVRLFLVCSRSKSPMFLSLPKRPHAHAADFIDWDGGSWSEVSKEGRSRKRLEQWCNGKAIHGDRFLMPYYGSTTIGRSINRPIGTLTTRDRFGVVNGDKMRMLTYQEARIAMGFPESTELPNNQKLAMHLLGNAVCPPVAKDFIEGILAA